MDLRIDTTDILGFRKVRQLIENETVSEAGRQRVAELMPLTNVSEVLVIQNGITALRMLIDRSDALPIQSFGDLRAEMGRCRVEGSYLPAEVLVAMGIILEQADQLRQFFRLHRDILKPVEYLIGRLDSLHPALRLIRRIVDPDGMVQDHASPELARIRSSMRHENHLLHRTTGRLMEAARTENWLHEENPTIREGRLVLPLRTEFKRKVQGVIHGQSATGATTYVEPLELLEINNRIIELEQDEKEEILRILIAVCGELRPYFPIVEHNIQILSELDWLNAAARFSRRFQATPPEIRTDDRRIRLIRARHPLLQLHKEVIPLDLDVPDGIRTVILTGPNAGGKTVAIKTVGLLCVMAMCGLPIPADEGSALPCFDSFLYDIGDQQSLEDDLSTFTSHMTHLRRFLEIATDRSLILIDELGTGTDPLEGAALGQVILEELIRRGATNFVTTHHNALKAFAETNPQVINAAMEFDSAGLKPTYRFQIGLPGSSYALAISRRIGIPEQLINRAHGIIGSEAVQLDQLLQEIETLKKNLRTEQEQIHIQRQKLAQLTAEYEEKTRLIRDREAQTDRRLAEQLEELVTASRARIEQTIRAIREQQAARTTIQEAHTVIEKVKAEAQIRRTRSAPRNSSQPGELTPGDWVRIDGISGCGQVIEISAGQKRVAIEVAGKTLWLQRETLHPIASPDKKSGSLIQTNLEPVTSFRLDLRGMRAEEAQTELIRYLDRVLLSGLNQIEIIHGKGTGALQKIVWDVLRTFRGVKSYEFDHFDRGGTGATIVHL